MVRRLVTGIFKLTTGLALLALTAFAILVVGARTQGYELRSVQSDSMRPMLSRGDAVLVNGGDRAAEIGDVVSYTSLYDPKLLITHRVVAVDAQRRMLMTKGDNSKTADTVMPAQAVQGTVVRSAPKIGYIMDALRRPVGLALLVYLPAIGVVIAEVRHLKRYYVGSVIRSPGRYYMRGY